MRIAPALFLPAWGVAASGDRNPCIIRGARLYLQIGGRPFSIGGFMDKKLDVYLTAAEVAAHLRYADSRPVRKMIRAGRFGRPIRFGRKWLIKAAHVPGWGSNGQ